jgi:hypothetical protein
LGWEPRRETERKAEIVSASVALTAGNEEDASKIIERSMWLASEGRRGGLYNEGTGTGSRAAAVKLRKLSGTDVCAGNVERQKFIRKTLQKGEWCLRSPVAGALHNNSAISLTTRHPLFATSSILVPVTEELTILYGL